MMQAVQEMGSFAAIFLVFHQEIAQTRRIPNVSFATKVAKFPAQVITRPPLSPPLSVPLHLSDQIILSSQSQRH